MLAEQILKNNNGQFLQFTEQSKANEVLYYFFRYNQYIPLWIKRSADDISSKKFVFLDW